MLEDLDDEDAQLVRMVSTLRDQLRSMRIDPRISTVLELFGSEDGSYDRGGATYSVDNGGFDVSVSWGMDAASDDRILYLTGDELIFVAKGAGDDVDQRVSIHDAVANPFMVAELSEALNS
ncbi:hypothetical protein V5F40_22720 [Xanthobacter sp. DSM 14520]|uniref:hypothetical protein n=1 Tax=Xanthobacter autotrophicus (strain ATCC BAA-1158 / Py2) TaxID=78245 RepID=UPI0037282046